MRCDQRKIYIISAIYALLLLLVPFLPNKAGGNAYVAAVAFFGALSAFLLIKKRRVSDPRRNDVAWAAALTAAVGIMILCLLGLHFGFYKKTVSLKNFTGYILPIAITVASAELFRSILLSQKQRSVRVISYLLFVLTDVFLLAERNAFRSVSSFMSLFGFVFLPAFTANVLCHILSFHYGARSVIPYRLVLALYPYLLPFEVAMPRAMLSFVKVLFPLLVLWLLSMLFGKRKMNHASRHKHTGLRVTASVLCLAFMLVCIGFVANMFHYRSIVVASGSMEPELSRGDIAVYEAYTGQMIQEGQVILFRRDGATIIHRVVDIKKINGVYRYYTKGDANDGMDSGYITNEDLVGITTMKVKYLGYPTVWLHEIFKK